MPASWFVSQQGIFVRGVFWLPVPQARFTSSFGMRKRQEVMKPLTQSTKLQNVVYEIRGPANAEAARLESEGHRILKLNIGSPAPFGFDAPDEIVRDMIASLPTASGYSESRGILPARRAVVSRYQLVEGFPEIDIDDVYIGNGVSELIIMTMQEIGRASCRERV